MKRSARTSIALTSALFVSTWAYAQQPPDVVQSDDDFNTAVGTSVMPLIDTGGRDGFFGAQRNTGVGYSALINDNTGSENTAVGTFALNFNGTGSNNTATGYFALACNTTGNLKTAFGYFALSSFYTLSDVNSCTSGFATGGANTATGA